MKKTEQKTARTTGLNMAEPPPCRAWINPGAAAEDLAAAPTWTPWPDLPEAARAREALPLPGKVLHDK